VLINKLQRKVKKQLFNKHFLMAIFCCLSLVVCGLLSKPAASYQQPIASQEKAQKKPLNLQRVKQDPTRPPSVMVQQLAPELAIKPEFELTAIFTRDNHQYAVVNGNVVKTGDPVADMLITEISRSNLTMKHIRYSQDAALKEIVVLELSGSVNVKKQVKK
jgi:hypothetical protein